MKKRFIYCLIVFFTWLITLSFLPVFEFINSSHSFWHKQPVLSVGIGPYGFFIMQWGILAVIASALINPRRSFLPLSILGYGMILIITWIEFINATYTHSKWGFYVHGFATLYVMGKFWVDLEVNSR